MIDERHVFALRFREFGTEMLDYAAMQRKRPGFYPTCPAIGDAGKLTIAAWERGYLTIPGLPELVAWVRDTKNVPKPECVDSGFDEWYTWDEKSGNPPMQDFPCGGEVLFRVLCGYQHWRTGEQYASGGILPTLLKDSPALPRPRVGYAKVIKNPAGGLMADLGQATVRQTQVRLDLQALVCRLLADEIEKSPDDKKNDKKEKYLRPLNTAASDCIRKYKSANKGVEKTAMKHVVEQYTAQNGGSCTTIMRILNDHSSEWKS